jgi:fructoselysine-6-P-deglycase FrlB-like protein
MTEMIAAEPALADRLVRRLRSDPVVGEVAKLVRTGPVRITGCGTSEHAAWGIAALLGEHLDPPPRALPALEVVRRPPSAGLLLAISHEGGTEITNEALRLAGEAGARTALITVGAGSPAAVLAELVIQTGEQDQSWCHTVGYLSPLLAGVALAGHLSGSTPDAAAIRALLDVTEDARPAADMAAALGPLDRLLVAGSGPDYVTARELALKIAEGAHMPTAARELETLMHGHLAAATRWTGLVVVDTGLGPSLVAERVHRLLSAAKALGVTAATIVSDGRAAELAHALTPGGRVVLPHTGRVPDTAGALLSSAAALQLLTERLARARGVNPDTLGREDPAQAAAHS